LDIKVGQQNLTYLLIFTLNIVEYHHSIIT